MNTDRYAGSRKTVLYTHEPLDSHLVIVQSSIEHREKTPKAGQKNMCIKNCSIRSFQLGAIVSKG